MTVTIHHAGETPPPARIMTPAERMTEDSNYVEFETDGMGRRIAVRALTFLDSLELREILGADLSANTSTLLDYNVIYAVQSIDNDPISPARTLTQLKALAKRLGFHGVKAAATAFTRQIERVAGDIGADAVKNS